MYAPKASVKNELTWLSDMILTQLIEKGHHDRVTNLQTDSIIQSYTRLPICGMLHWRTWSHLTDRIMTNRVTEVWENETYLHDLYMYCPFKSHGQSVPIWKSGNLKQDLTKLICSKECLQLYMQNWRTR